MRPTLQPFLTGSISKVIPQIEASVEKIFKQTDKVNKKICKTRWYSPKSSMEIQRGNC